MGKFVRTVLVVQITVCIDDIYGSIESYNRANTDADQVDETDQYSTSTHLAGGNFSTGHSGRQESFRSSECTANYVGHTRDIKLKTLCITHETQQQSMRLHKDAHGACSHTQPSRPRKNVFLAVPRSNFRQPT